MSTENRPTDTKNTGGVKGLTTATINIVPFVAESVSTVSPGEMRVNIEGQFRRVADVTNSIVLASESIQSNVTGVADELVTLEDKVKDMDASTGGLSSKVDALQSDLSDTKTKLAGVEALVDSLNTQILALQAKDVELITAINSLDARVTVLEEAGSGG